MADWNWGSIAEWATALVAVPAALLFLLDRRSAERDRLTVRATDFHTFWKVDVRYRPATFDRGIAARFEADSPSDAVFGDITHQEPATRSGTPLWVRLEPAYGDDQTLHCRVTVSSPSGLPSSVMMKVSLVRTPGKKPFTSRKIRISAIS